MAVGCESSSFVTYFSATGVGANGTTSSSRELPHRRQLLRRFTLTSIVFLGSLKENKRVISGVPCLSKNPLPFIRGMKGAAGKLPIKKVYFLLLVAIPLHTNVLIPLSHALDLF